MRHDPAMLGSSVHSRAANDLYATIDRRCVAHLDKVWPLADRVFVEPCAGYGDLVREIEAHGGVLHDASDLHAYAGSDERIRTDVNVFGKPCQLRDIVLITNPPYTILRPVIKHLLNQAPAAWVVILCRASQLHVQDMRPMLHNDRFYAVAPLPFRPVWHMQEPGERGNTPRHEYAWFIWAPQGYHRGQARVLL